MGQGGILGTTQLGARLGEYCQWGERCPPHTQLPWASQSQVGRKRLYES